MPHEALSSLPSFPFLPVSCLKSLSDMPAAGTDSKALTHSQPPDSILGEETHGNIMPCLKP